MRKTMPTGLDKAALCCTAQPEKTNGSTKLEGRTAQTRSLHTNFLTRCVVICRQRLPEPHRERVDGERA